MRLLHAGALTGMFALFTFALLFSGCRPADEDDDLTPRRRRSAGTAVSAAVEAKLKALAGKDGKTGVIKGRVVWEGDLPDVNAEIKIDKDVPYCARGEGGPSPIHPYETQQQEFRIGANKNLGNVYVWIEAPRGFHFDVPEEVLKAVPKEVHVSQPHCTFLPHCSIHVPRYHKDGDAVQTGQVLIIENDAWVPHSAQILGSNVQLKARTQGSIDSISRTLSATAKPIELSCGVHPWMKALVGVYNHPFVALSSVGADLKSAKKVYENMNDPNVGTFEIRGVPVGHKVRIKAYHERLGYLNDGEAKGQEIELVGTLDLQFTARMK